MRDDEDDSLSSSGDGGPEEPSTPLVGSLLRRARAAGADAFPAPGWERYQPVRLLGKGGMGRVFLAYEPRLRRNVALKFLHADAPVRTHRFFAEARAQARVEHERVCRVYEVGEVQGQPYIAMQFVDGQPLGSLRESLTLEQKVMVLRDAAEGVHAAHRAGLIHRDLKPSNIMVERTEDGALKAYVMDFGIARDWQGEGTATGAVLGTPQYMAPEQARGEVSGLDRRADVYSLGATLYFLLTGKAPIRGENGLEVISRVGTVEPEAPRALDRNIPAELEAIVLRCLEKERSQRYDSARALAEDLTRFLDGEPVHARSTGAWYRLRKRARKHRVLVAVSAASFLLVALAGAQALLARREAAERERLARRFTEQVEHLEALARYSGLSPLHDTRADRKALRASMATLEAEIGRAGALGTGPGRYALGRGHLALGDLERAHAALQAAWDGGYREPRVAYALALVLGQRYQRGRLEAERLRSAELREAELRAVERRFREPALQYLRLSEGTEVPSRAYAAALLAYYEGRLDDALGQLDAAGGGLPWFYEAPALRGDVLLARATRHWNKGERDAALADFEAGRAAYARAAAIGESVPRLHTALAELEHGALLMELYGKGDVAPPFARGMAALERARAADPDDFDARLLEATLRRRLAEFRLNHGEDALEPLQAALAAARAALALAPSRPEPHDELGRAYRLWASLRQQRGEDPREQLQAAVSAFERVPDADRSYEFHTLLGLVFKVWATYDDEAGLDSRAHRERSIQAYRAAIALDAQLPEAWTNLGIAHLARARHPREPDADGALREARAALDRALALNPRNVVPYFQSAQVRELEAQRQRDRGQDPTGTLAAALELYRRGLAINPRLPQLHNGEGAARLALARAEWDAGRSPEPELQRAQEAFERARAAAPEHGFADLNLVELSAERAAYALAAGRDPLPSVARAQAWFARAAALLPGRTEPWTNVGRAHVVAAAFLLQEGRDPGAHLARAREVLGRALSRNAREAQAWAQLGEARGIAARWQARAGRARAEDFEAAAAAFQKALELEPSRLAPRLPYGQLCRAWGRWRAAAGQAPAPPLQQGLKLADEVLSARPGLAEAWLLRASLQAALAASAQGEERALLLARAREDAARARARNPALRAPRDEPSLDPGVATASP